MIVEPILLLILFARFRKQPEILALHPDMSVWLKKALVLTAILMGLHFIINAQAYTGWIFQLALLAIVFLIYTRPALSPVRPMLYPFLPMVAISFLMHLMELVPGEWADTLHGYLQSAWGFAVIWMVAMFIINNKQRKALEKERKKRLEEEEQKKVIAIRKAELEEMVVERTAELTRQKEELEDTLNHLQETQKQLIQSEKMASLGELTAGIAHEIQNPLNFVNNFSEVNTELARELAEELNKITVSAADKGNLMAIARDIIQNQDKINFHGRRADEIVKSMLMHSRNSTGEKEDTDINALADEYLRLSFHGLRAKDKSFQAAFKTDFDPLIGKIKIVPQDIGRVILNLVNNAFYAVNEKHKKHPPGYEPLVTVKTRRRAGQVIITISDNGNGIPENIREKIFQPFFTTKPTGRGTGLGLSLSYDIITKGHGGEIEVNSEEGKGSEFVITIPVV